MSAATDLRVLLEEYRAMVFESLDETNEIDWEKLQIALSTTGEWTDFAAQHLVNLVRRYGVFTLRNALSLAIAAEIEDGDLGI